ncbi:MAG: FtsX-like permease family protein [Candidatus Binatia bacterium]
MLRLLRLISYPQLRASWGRVLLIVGGIATGVSLIVALNVLNTSVLDNFRRSMELIAGPADLQVTLGLGEIGFPESTVATVGEDSDVEVAVPLVRGTIALADDPANILQLFGTDLTMGDRLPRYEVELAGKKQSARQAANDVVADPRAILVPQTFAADHDLKVGSEMIVSTPRGVQTLVVRGLLIPSGLAAAFGGRLAIMDLTAAQQFLDKEGRIDQIDVVLKSGVDRKAAEQRLTARLSPLTVAEPAQRAVVYESVLASVQAMLSGLSLLCLIAGAYIVYNTTSTGSIERALTMAQLRFVGADERQLFRLLMCETLVLGIVGAALGEAYGLALAYLLRGSLGVGFNTIFQLRFPLDTIRADLVAQASIMALGVLTAVGASYSAALRVRALDPLEVLRRSSGSQTLGRQRTSRLIVAWVAMIAMSGLAFAAEIAFKSFEWGNIGSTFWNASVFVIAVPLVTWAARRLQHVLPKLFGPEGRFAADSILRAPTRAGVTVAAISGVVTASVTVASLSQSFQMSVRDYVAQAIGGDIVVSAVTTEGGWLETPIPESLGAEIAAVPGIQRVEDLRALPGQPFRDRRIGILALSDGMLDAEHLPPHWYRSGDPAQAAAALAAGTGVNISLSLADWSGLAVGDELSLETPTGRLTLPVVGIVPEYTSDRGTVILSRKLFVTHWQDHSVSRFMVFVKPGTDIAAVRAGILARVADRYRLKVDPLREAVQYISDKIKAAFGFTDAIQLLISIVTAAGIFDLLLSAIAERRRELALWRVIGATESAVRRSIMIESGTLGAFGVAVGAALGYVSAAIWVLINYRYLLGFFLEFHFAFLSAAISFLMVVLMALAAGYGASRAATRQPILDGIRLE